MTIDSIELLSRGKPTPGKVGSRGVPHRLRQEERVVVEAAKRKGYLALPPESKGVRWRNLRNCFMDYCSAVQFPSVVVMQSRAPASVPTPTTSHTTSTLSEALCQVEVSLHTVEPSNRHLVRTALLDSVESGSELCLQLSQLEEVEEMEERCFHADGMPPPRSVRHNATLLAGMAGGRGVISTSRRMQAKDAKRLAATLVSRVRAAAKQWGFIRDHTIWRNNVQS